MATYYGKTVEEAIESGLKELGLDRENAEIKVIEDAKKGFLGINSKKAEVEVTPKKSDGERSVEFLKGLFDIMNVSAECVLNEEDEKIVIDVKAARSSSVIGYRGEILDALQTLAGAVANIGRDDYRRVVVDCEDYREKREETLKSLAEKLAAKAVRTGRKIVLEPMSPYERRVLHSTLADSTEVKTESEGKEPNRYVVIIPNDLRFDEPEDASYRRGQGNNDRKGGYRGGRTEKYGDRGDRGGNRSNGRYGNRNGDRTERYGDRAPRQPRPKTSGWGTFLGNSNTDKTE